MLFALNKTFPDEDLVGTIVSIPLETNNKKAPSVKNYIRLSNPRMSLGYVARKDNSLAKVFGWNLNYVGAETPEDVEWLNNILDTLGELGAIVIESFEYKDALCDKFSRTVSYLDKDFNEKIARLFTEPDYGFDLRLRQMFLSLACQYYEDIPILRVNHDAKGISRWVVSMDRDDPWKDISGFTPIAAGETKYKCFAVNVDFYASILRKATKSIA